MGNQLSNGLTVKYKSSCNRIGFSKFSGCLCVGVGHINEPSLGLASLFERILFLEATGIMAVFGGTMTAYTASGWSLGDVIDKLSQVFNSSVITDELVERAKKIIAEEVRQTSFQTLRQMKLLYKQTAFGALVCPPEEFLEKLNSYTAADVCRFADTYYTAKNAVLIIEGPQIPVKNVLEELESCLGYVPAGEKKEGFVAVNYTGGFGRIDVQDDVTRLMFGWDLSRFNMADSPVMNVLLSLLLRQLEKVFSYRISDVHVAVNVVDYYCIRTARVFISSSTASARGLTKIFVREINELCDDWISERLLDSVCNNAMVERLDKYERSDNKVLEMAWQLVGRGGAQDVSSRISGIEMTTAEDVRCMAERLFRGSRVTYIAATSSKDDCYSYKELLTALRSEFLIEKSDE